MIFEEMKNPERKAAFLRRRGEAVNSDPAEVEAMAALLAHPLTLDDCLVLAMTNNYAVRKAELDRQLGRFRRDMAFSAFLPQVSATATRVDYDKDPVLNSQRFTSGGVDVGLALVMPSTWFLYDEARHGRAAADLAAGYVRQGVTLQNAPKFHLVPQRCRQVVIDGVSARCPWNAQNGDGIDLMNCQDVLVTRCRVDVGDDGICLKGGVGEAGVQAGPCARIVIADNIVFRAHGGFVIGSEFSGGMHDIFVYRNTFSGTDTGLRFKSAPGRGGNCRNIRISDIIMSDIREAAVIFETSYADRPVGSAEAVKQRRSDFVPDFSDIQVRRVTCRDARTAVVSTGTLEMIHDVTLTDCVFFYTETATRIDDAAMIRFDKVRFETFVNN